MKTYCQATDRLHFSLLNASIIDTNLSIHLYLMTYWYNRIICTPNSGADTGKNEPSSKFPGFIQYLPDFLQHFPDFSQTKFFKVRKCERCGSLNPSLELYLVSTRHLFDIHTTSITLNEVVRMSKQRRLLGNFFEC